jgi:hypothetical protein
MNKENLWTSDLYYRCLSTDDGQKILKHLRSITLDRALGPEASDMHLRYLEGQRQLVLQMINLVERGRERPATPSVPESDEPSPGMETIYD